MRSVFWWTLLITSVACQLGRVLSVLPVLRTAREGGSVRPFEKSEFQFGKDREVFHASVDLNWLVRRAVDISTWQALLKAVLTRIKRMNGDFDNEYTFKEIATDLTCEFRECNSDSPLRCLHIPLLAAHKLACDKQRLVVFYIEKETWEATRRTALARNALAATVVGQLLNNQFLFMASVDTHPYATTILRDLAEHLAQQDLLGQLTQYDTRRPLIQNEGAARTILNSELQRLTPKFPVLVVLSPVPQPPPLWNLPIPSFLRRSRADFEIVGVLPMHAADVFAEDVIRFLQRIVYSPQRRGTRNQTGQPVGSTAATDSAAESAP